MDFADMERKLHELTIRTQRAENTENTLHRIAALLWGLYCITGAALLLATYVALAVQSIG